MEENLERLRELAEKLSSTEYELSRVNAFLAAIVQSSSEAILSKNLEGYLITWNPAAEKLYGYKADEVIGRHVSFLVPEHKQDELDVIMENVSQGQGTLLETQRIRKDGKIIEVKLTVSSIRDRNGKIIGASAIAHPANWQWEELEELNSRD